MIIKEGRLDIERFFVPNEEASYISSDGKRYLETAIEYRGKKTKRNIMANKQSLLPVVSVEQTIAYVNDFLDCISDEKTNANDEIELDGACHKIIRKCLIVKGCKWDETVFNCTYDSKYDDIKRKFGLQNVWDILWMKFAINPKTEQKYLGVVAISNDINYDYKNSSGKLVSEVGFRWDESFVCIFPLTKDLLRYKSRIEIETGVGNYLIYRGVPIIDYYSHNNFSY